MTTPPISRGGCARESVLASSSSSPRHLEPAIKSSRIVGSLEEDELFAQLYQDHKIDAEGRINPDICPIPQKFLIHSAAIQIIRTFFTTPFPVVAYLNNASKREIKADLAKLNPTPDLQSFLALPLLQEDPEDQVTQLRTSIIPAAYFLKLCRNQNCRSFKLFGGESRRALAGTFLEMLKFAFKQPLPFSEQKFGKLLQKCPDWDFIFPVEGKSFDELRDINESIIQEFCQSIFGLSDPKHFNYYRLVVRRVLCKAHENFSGDSFSTGITLCNGIDDKIDLNFSPKKVHDDIFTLYTPGIWISTTLLEQWLNPSPHSSPHHESAQMTLALENSPRDNCLQAGFDILFDILRRTRNPDLSSNPRIFIKHVSYIAGGMRSFDPTPVDPYVQSLLQYCRNNQTELHQTLATLILDWLSQHHPGNHRALLAMIINFSVLLVKTQEGILEKLIKVLEPEYLSKAESSEEKGLFEWIALALSAGTPVAIIIALLQAASFLSLLADPSTSRAQLREHEKKPAIQLIDTFAIMLHFLPEEALQLLLEFLKERRDLHHLVSLGQYLLHPLKFDCASLSGLKRNHQHVKLDLNRLSILGTEMIVQPDLLLQSLGYSLLLALQMLESHMESLPTLLAHLPRIIQSQRNSFLVLDNLRNVIAQSPFRSLTTAGGALENVTALIARNHITPQRLEVEWLLLLADTADPKLTPVAVREWEKLSKEWPPAERSQARKSLSEILLKSQASYALRLIVNHTDPPEDEDWHTFSKVLRACMQSHSKSSNGSMATLFLQAVRYVVANCRESTTIPEIAWVVQEIAKAYPDQLADMLPLLDENDPKTGELILSSCQSLLKQPNRGYIKALELWNRPEAQNAVKGSMRREFIEKLSQQLAPHSHPARVSVRLEAIEIDFREGRNPEVKEELLTLWNQASLRERRRILRLGEFLLGQGLSDINAMNEARRRRESPAFISLLEFNLILFQRLGKIQATKTHVKNTLALLTNILKDHGIGDHPLPNAFYSAIMRGHLQLLIHMAKMSLYAELIDYLKLLINHKLSPQNSERSLQYILFSIHNFLQTRVDQPGKIADCDFILSSIHWPELSPRASSLRAKVTAQLLDRLTSSPIAAASADRTYYWIQQLTRQQGYSQDRLIKWSEILIPILLATPIQENLIKIVALLRSLAIANGTLWSTVLEAIAATASQTVRRQAWELFELSVSRQSYSNRPELYENGCIHALNSLRDCHEGTFVNLLKRFTELLLPCDPTSSRRFLIVQILFQGAVEYALKLKNPDSQVSIERWLEWRQQQEAFLSGEKASSYRAAMDGTLIPACAAQGNLSLFLKGLDFLKKVACLNDESTIENWINAILEAISHLKGKGKTQELLAALCLALPDSTAVPFNRFILVEACCSHSSPEVNLAGFRLLQAILSRKPGPQPPSNRKFGATLLQNMFHANTHTQIDREVINLLKLSTLPLWFDEKTIALLWAGALRVAFRTSAPDALSLFCEHYPKAKSGGDPSVIWLKRILDILIPELEGDNIELFNQRINQVMPLLFGYPSANPSIPGIDTTLLKPPENSEEQKEGPPITASSVDEATRMIFLHDPTLLFEFFVESNEESLQKLHQNISTSFQAHITSDINEKRLPSVCYTLQFLRMEDKNQKDQYIGCIRVLIHRLSQLRPRSLLTANYLTNLIAQYLVFIIKQYPEYDGEIMLMVEDYFLGAFAADHQGVSHKHDDEDTRLQNFVFMDHQHWCFFILQLILENKDWNVKKRYIEKFFMLSLHVNPFTTPAVDYFPEKSQIILSTVARLASLQSSILARRALDILATHQTIACLSPQEIKRSYKMLLEVFAKDPFYPFFLKKRVFIENAAQNSTEKYVFLLKKPLYSFLQGYLVQLLRISAQQRTLIVHTDKSFKVGEMTASIHAAMEIFSSHFSLLCHRSQDPHNPQDLLYIAMRFLGQCLDLNCFSKNYKAYFAALTQLISLILQKLKESKDKESILKRYDIAQFFEAELKMDPKEKEQEVFLFLEWIRGLVQSNDPKLITKAKDTASTFQKDDYFKTCPNQLKELTKIIC